MLHINDLIYRIGGRLLFDQATAAITEGRRVGLIGRNGAGKTTLFKLILGAISADGGSVNVRKNISIGTVAQEAPGGSTNLLDTVLAADTERTDLLNRSETATTPEDIADIHNRLADIDAQTAPSRAARILAGLGFDEPSQAKPLNDFSGGWRMRVALAAVLFSKPRLLLLDEPTNHLDLEAALWLEDYLSSWQGTVLIISHDRHFLNNVVNEIIHLEALRLVKYSGNYDQFEKTRAEKQLLDAKLRTRQLAERRHIESFVDRFRYKASKAKQAQSRLKMLERMEPIASAVENITTTFKFPDPDPLSPPLIAMDDVDVGYEEGKPILKKLGLNIDMDDRIALIGANGNGKSTLAKLLSDRLKPMAGKVAKSSKLRIGYFAQHQTDELVAGDTPFEHLRRLMPMTTEGKIRSHLATFGFDKQKSDTVSAKLSGGEKARLLFAMMSQEKPHILLLDEPTNHLDVDAREALVQALNNYDGAVILVSHDVHMVELVCDRLWLVSDGGCKTFDGDLSDYRKLLMEERRQQRRQQRQSSENDNDEAGNAPKQNRKSQRQDRARARQATADLRKSVRQQEQNIARLNAKKDDIENKLSHPDAYAGSTSDLMALQVALGNVKRDIEKAEETWLQASEKLETAN